MPNLRVIADLAHEIQSTQPNLTPGMRLSSYVRHSLEALACECGIPASMKPNNADLISIYLVAKKDPVAAIRVAERIRMRLDTALLSFQIPPVYEDQMRVDESSALKPVPRPRWKTPPREEFDPLATPPKATPSADPDAIRALIKREVKEGALDPLQRVLEATDKSLRGDFAELLADARAETLSDVRETIAAEAHKAAIEAVQGLTPTRLEISLDSAPPVALGLVHRDTTKIINALAAGVNVYMHGPAGSGKTTVANKCAEAFGLKSYFAAKVESEYQLMGFKDAKGETVRTQFREAYEHGGVFLFDEMDASSPSAVVALNMALANGMCAFPDGTIARHVDFKCLGAGNTKLTGASRAYAGRNQLDAASIDRFSFIEFGYDNELELALATDQTWARYVQAVRSTIAARGLNHLVTPRATYDGCKLLKAGFDWETVASMVVYKGLDADTVKQIEQAIDYSKAA